MSEIFFAAILFQLKFYYEKKKKFMDFVKILFMVDMFVQLQSNCV